MRILNLLNGSEGSQFGMEDGFQFLKQSGRIEAVYNFYYSEFYKKNNLSVTLGKIKEIAVTIDANVIIIFHVGNCPIPKEFYRELKSLKSKPILVCDEHDGFEKFRKPLPKATQIAMSEAHIISLCGLGSIVSLIPKNDRYKIIFTPHLTSIQRFDKQWTPTRTRKYDVIMIGNRIKSKIPFKSLTGTCEREKLVKMLGNCYQERFAVYGRGWDGFTGNKGPIDFKKQIETIRESWLTIGFDHCTGMSFYFSNRLPISMFAGVAHVCHYHLGYELLFEQGKDLFWFKSLNEAIDITRMMLSRGPSYLIKLGIDGRKKAIECFSPEVVWGDFVETIKKFRSRV